MTKPTMGRRRFLAARGGVGITTIGGCSGGGDGGGGTPTDSPTPSPTPTPTTPNQQAVDHYNSAIDELVTIKETMDPWAEEDGFHGDASDIRDLRDTLKTANSALSAAEDTANPNGDFIDQIEQAQLVATLQEGLIGFYDLALNFFNALDTAVRLQENDENDRAAEKWGEAEQLVKDMRSLFDDTKAVHGEINHEELDEAELDYTGDFTEYLLIGHRQELVANESYMNAWELVNLAFVKVGEGTMDYDNEEWVAAREDWETGRTYLEDAQADFEAVIDNQHAGDEIKSISNDMLDFVEILLNGFDKLIKATQEAESGNLGKAEELAQEGFKVFEEV